MSRTRKNQDFERMSRSGDEKDEWFVCIHGNCINRNVGTGIWNFGIHVAFGQCGYDELLVNVPRIYRTRSVHLLFGKKEWLQQ